MDFALQFVGLGGQRVGGVLDVAGGSTGGRGTFVHAADVGGNFYSVIV